MAAGTASTTASAAPATTSFARNPLTTAFSRPAECTGIYKSSFLTVMDTQSSCLPDGFKSQTESYFSPGLICPSGYVSACHDNTKVASQTTVTCCPTYNSDISLSCVTGSTLSGAWATLFCTWIGPSQKTSLPLTFSGNGVTSTVMQDFKSPGGINAFGIRMVYQKTDIETTAKKTSATTATPSSDPTSATDSAATDDSSSSSSSSSDDNGLSTGAKAAIGVVIPLVVLALLAGVLLWRRRRRQRQRTQEGPLYKYEPAQATPQPHAELHGEHVHEMQGSPVNPVELPATEPHRPTKEEGT